MDHTYMHTLVQATATEMLQKARGLAGFSTAATCLKIQKQRARWLCSGDDCITYRSPAAQRRLATDRGHIHVAVGARSWPRRRQGEALSLSETHGDARFRQRGSSARRKHPQRKRTRLFACSGRALDTRTHGLVTPWTRRPRRARQRQLRRRTEQLARRPRATR